MKGKKSFVENSDFDFMKGIPYSEFVEINILCNIPNQLTQCCTQFRSPGVKILCRF